MDESNPGPPFDWAQSERLLVRTFEAWRSEFRGILEDHRREIQARLEKIEREIEKKSDKETVGWCTPSRRTCAGMPATSRPWRPGWPTRWKFKRCGRWWVWC